MQNSPLAVTRTAISFVITSSRRGLSVKPSNSPNPASTAILKNEIPFDNILDRVTGSDPSVTDYILEAPAKCPNCRREILEKTLIEPK
jgi:hypothetical protein